MGGEESEVTEATSEVLLEAANFEPLGILRSSERLALRTEGSNRWEKGVDPHLAEPAAVLASRLIVDLAGARMTGHVDVHDGLPERPVVRLRPERASALIGLDVPPDEQRAILAGLGFEVVATDWDVTVPTWRARDVTREVDLIEEVARADPRPRPVHDAAAPPRPGRLSKEQRLRRRRRGRARRRGAVRGVHLEPRRERSEPGCDPAPGADDVGSGVLRTTIVPGLVEAARTALDAGADDVALFEIARVYLPSGEPLPDERWRVGGRRRGGFDGGEGRRRDALRGAPRRASRRARRARAPPPGQGGRDRGGLARRAPPDAARGGLGRVRARPRDALRDGVPERIVYEDVITYPAALQDIAVAVDEDVEVGALVDAAREAAGPLLREARVFDVYRGEQVGEGRKSVAIHLAFQSPERTLTEDEATELRGRDRRGARRAVRCRAARRSNPIRDRARTCPADDTPARARNRPRAPRCS